MRQEGCAILAPNYRIPFQEFVLTVTESQFTLTTSFETSLLEALAERVIQRGNATGRNRLKKGVFYIHVSNERQRENFSACRERGAWRRVL